MTTPSLSDLLDHLHRQVEGELTTARGALVHPTDKGDASEAVWIELLTRYLPRRYAVNKAHIVDSEGNFSEQIDVVIHDRQYSPLVFTFKDALYISAESVYAVFEAKQVATSETVRYSQAKAASVRGLVRTSVSVPTVDGQRPPKEPTPILAGLLALSCPWSPPLGDTLKGYLDAERGNSVLDLGCIADAGVFYRAVDGSFSLEQTSRATTRFLFELIARLQDLGTVPMLDVRAYSAHIP